MLTAAQLKQITTEARPIIERMLEDAERLAGLRDVVAAAGGDWGQLKALIKAQIKDEQDEAGEGKHVRKFLDKADYATAYADMLGISAFSKMNEENFFAGDIPHDAETGEITEPSPAAQIAAGLTEALAVVKGEAEPHRVHQIPGNSAGSAETEAPVATVGATASANPSQPVAPDHRVEANTAQTGRTAIPLLTTDAGLVAVESPVTVLVQDSGVEGEGQAGATREHSSGELSQPLLPNGRVENTPDGQAVTVAAPHSNPAVPLTQERGATGDESAVIPSAALVAPNVVSIRTHNPDTHFLNSKGMVRLHGCLKPEVCGSSQPRVRLCHGCSLKHDGPPPSGEVA